MKAKTVYLIGNGFDIQHKLPTNYWDFREFLIANHEEFIRRMEELYNIQPLDDTEPWYRPEMEEHWNAHIKETLWWNFEHDIGFPDVESMMSFSSSARCDVKRDGLFAKIKEAIIQCLFSILHLPIIPEDL